MIGLRILKYYVGIFFYYGGPVKGDDIKQQIEALRQEVAD